MPPTLEAILRQRPPGRIADVIARMEAIGAALPAGDGVAAFNRLYLEVTRGVLDSLRPGRFEDARFLRWLDVVFANLCFEALRALVVGPGPAPGPGRRSSRHAAGRDTAAPVRARRHERAHQPRPAGGAGRDVALAARAAAPAERAVHGLL